MFLRQHGVAYCNRAVPQPLHQDRRSVRLLYNPCGAFLKQPDGISDAAAGAAAVQQVPTPYEGELGRRLTLVVGVIGLPGCESSCAMMAALVSRHSRLATITRFIAGISWHSLSRNKAVIMAVGCGVARPYACTVYRGRGRTPRPQTRLSVPRFRCLCKRTVNTR